MEIMNIRVQRRVVTGKYEHIEIDLEAKVSNDERPAEVINELDRLILEHVGNVI